MLVCFFNYLVRSSQCVPETHTKPPGGILLPLTVIVALVGLYANKLSLPSNLYLYVIADPEVL